MQEAGLYLKQEVASQQEVVLAGQCLLTTLGCAGVLITCGATGMSLFERADAKPIQIPAAAREVYDVTGAGGHGQHDGHGHPGDWPPVFARLADALRIQVKRRKDDQGD